MKKKSMIRQFTLIGMILLFACQPRKEDACQQDFLVIPIGGKLEALLSLPQDTVLDYYDLSHDFLFDFPDLSGYNIKSLNMSHNRLDALNVDFLPQQLEVLDLSHNCLGYFPQVAGPIRNLKELDLSHNDIQHFSLFSAIDRINLSYNDLSYIYLNWHYMYYDGYWDKKNYKATDYLNISHNPKLSNKVWFIPSMVDTIIYDHIANGERLQMRPLSPTIVD